VTQQNAALVEQAAAAAESLEEQAEQLTELISTFRLTGGRAHQTLQRKVKGGLVSGERRALPNTKRTSMAQPGLAAQLKPNRSDEEDWKEF